MNTAVNCFQIKLASFESGVDYSGSCFVDTKEVTKATNNGQRNKTPVFPEWRVGWGGGETQQPLASQIPVLSIPKHAEDTLVWDGGIWISPIPPTVAVGLWTRHLVSRARAAMSEGPRARQRALCSPAC